jgi:hypothetical protein
MTFHQQLKKISFSSLGSNQKLINDVIENLALGILADPDIR